MINSVFRGKIKGLFKTVTILKGYLSALAAKARKEIYVRKVVKIQKGLKQFLLERRMQKYKIAGTKAVTRITAYYRMRKERIKFLKIRNKVIALQANIRFFLSMSAFIRLKHCREVAHAIFEEGWQKIEHAKAVMIQKHWKGFAVRKRYKKVMEEIRKKLRLRKYQEHFHQVIFQNRFQKYLKALNRYKDPIIRLQAAVRGKLVHRTYHMVKKAAIFIQKAYRRHLKKKYYLIRLWKDFRKNLYS